jgi:hypothetical protein
VNFFRWLAGLFRRKAPTLPRPIVGVVVHRLDDTDVAQLRAMGVSCIRCSLYADGSGAEVVDRAVAEGFDVLVCSYRSSRHYTADRNRWPMAKWQFDNEPDWTTETAVDASIETRGGDVTSGLAHGTPAEWAAQFFAELPPMIGALHAYGSPLTAAIAETIPKRDPSRDTWLTEIGSASADELRDALASIDGRIIRRVYVYALWSPDDAYTLTPAHRDVIGYFTQ